MAKMKFVPKDKASNVVSVKHSSYVRRAKTFKYALFASIALNLGLIIKIILF